MENSNNNNINNNTNNNNNDTSIISHSPINKLAPILTFSASSDEPLDPLSDKQPLVEESFSNFSTRLPPTTSSQMKSMISRSCMTSRETSDLENHLAAMNNFEINFQSLGHNHPRLTTTHESKPSKRNALVIGEAYINWDNEPNMEFIDASLSTMNVAAAAAPPSVFNHTSSFEPRMILRLDSGMTRVTLETGPNPTTTSAGGVNSGGVVVSKPTTSGPRKVYHHHQMQSRVTVKAANESADPSVNKESVICENVIEDDIYYDQPVHGREQWTRKTEFLLAIIGFSVDLGNIWRFPMVVQENGGGKFLIPYFIQLALCGLPLFYMELALGQFHHTGLFTLWEKLCPMFKGLAFTAFAIDIFMAMFYNTIIAWSVYYLFMSFRSEVMWKGCNREWNTLCCLPIEKPKYANITIDNIGYQQSGSDSFVYRIFQINSKNIRNRIVMYNTSNETLDFLEGVKHVYESLNINLTIPSDEGRHVPIYDTNLKKCYDDKTVYYNYTCELEDWMQSFHVVSNGRIVDSPRPYIDPRDLARYVHNPKLITDLVEHTITQAYANEENVDIILNCGKAYMNNPTDEFFNRFLTKINESTGLEELGGFNYILIGCLFLVFVTVYFALWKGIKSAGKAVWITATAPYIVMFVLLVHGLTLDGSLDGVKYYITVSDWAGLAEIKVWISAATQIFFSLGPGFGTIIALSSYNKTNNNCYRDALLTSFINCLTSILSGFVVFSTLGHMFHVQGKKMKDLENAGPGLIFIAYPQAIALMPGAPFWAILFFFMLFTLGIDSTFGGLEAVITGVCDAFPTKIGKRRSLFVFALIAGCFLGALPTVTYGGPYIVQLLDYYTVAPSILIVVFFETIGVMYIYGCDRFCDDINFMIGSRPNFFWILCWKYISPAIILVMASAVCWGIIQRPLVYGKYVYRGIGEVLAALIVIVPCLFIPVYAIYRIYKTPGTLRQRFEKLMKSKEPKMSRRRSMLAKENGDGSMNLDSMYNSSCVILNNQKESRNAVPL